MPSRSIPGRLALPVAVIVAAGLVSAPLSTGSTATSTRFVELSAVRLQAEATTLIAGLTHGTAASTAAALPGAAAASSATAAATSEPCYYPCTIFDKFLASLPPEIRSILLPPLIALATAIGAVLAPVLLVTSLVFDWPYQLRPAAAGRPEDQAGPAAAGDPDDSAATATQADPSAPAAVPVVPAAEVGVGPVVRRGAERTAADAPAEADVARLDAAHPAEPQTTEPQTEARVTETRPDGAEALAAELNETLLSEGPSVAAEAEPTDATAVADAQSSGAATRSATEAPAAASSTRAATRSAR